MKRTFIIIMEWGLGLPIGTIAFWGTLVPQILTVDHTFKCTNSLVRLSTQLCMSGSKSFTCKSINHIIYIYCLRKFQVNNYDSWITVKNKIINVFESDVKDGSKTGNVIDQMAMRENCDNFEFSHDELNDMLKYDCTE